MAEIDGGEGIDEVDVLIAVNVPCSAAASPLDEEGRYAVRVLRAALAERLAAERNDALRTLLHVLGLHVAA